MKALIQNRRMLLGLLACACFLLQQVSVHLHLALNDHIVLSADSGHHHTHAADSHGGPGHRHAPDEHGPSNPSDGDHGDSHPLRDHLVELAAPSASPSVSHLAFALAPQSTPTVAPVLLHGRRVLQFADSPRPPPPRSACGSRAPPIFA